MKKLIVSFLALIITTPIVPASLFSVMKEAAKSGVIAAQMYGSYRLLNQGNKLHQATAMVAHIPFICVTQMLFDFINDIEFKDKKLAFDFERVEIPSVEGLLSPLVYTVCLVSIIGFAKN
jgi:hypothetical protein